MCPEPSRPEESRERSDLTLLLNEAAKGDQEAAARILPVVYEELRRMANAKRKAMGARGETLRSTALVHEAYARIVDREPEGWKARSHFYYAAARAMRDILVEQARRQAAGNRAGLVERVTVQEAGIAVNAPPEQVLALNRCLDELESKDEQAHKIVMFRFFAGMPMREIAEVLDTSVATVERRWTFLRSWLATELSRT